MFGLQTDTIYELDLIECFVLVQYDNNVVMEASSDIIPYCFLGEIRKFHVAFTYDIVGSSNKQYLSCCRLM